MHVRLLSTISDGLVRRNNQSGPIWTTLKLQQCVGRTYYWWRTDRSTSCYLLDNLINCIKTTVLIYNVHNPFYGCFVLPSTSNTYLCLLVLHFHIIIYDSSKCDKGLWLGYYYLRRNTVQYLVLLPGRLTSYWYRYWYCRLLPVYFVLQTMYSNHTLSTSHHSARGLPQEAGNGN